MSVQESYNEWSTSYDTDQNLTRDLDAQVTREKLGDMRFHSILELGCGTGKNTIFLAQIGSQVEALDFSEGMIEKAREKVQAGNVRFSMADLTQRWSCQDASYDLVVCNLVLEHIEDLSFIFAETFRVLKPEGMFLLNELHPFRQYEAKKARFQREEEVTEIPAFVHHISDFLKAASDSNLRLVQLDERWHTDDQEGRPPRIIAFLFQK
jgi:malonyl-CoA O-methyltransferase